MDKIKILYAEDDMLTRLEVREKLESKGWEVVEAADGIEAVEKYRQCNPDLMILDVDMPRRTGLEVLQLIRVNDLHTPVVIYSSLTKEEDLMAGLTTGAEVYIIKNYSVDFLLLQIEKLMNDKASEVIELAEGITYNFMASQLKIGDQIEKLSMLESRIFTVLCKNKNKLSRRDLLLQTGWNSDEFHLEVQLNKVVCKLKQFLKGTDKLEIVLDRGNGYWLKTKSEEK